MLHRDYTRQVNSEQANPGQANPGQANPGQANPGQANPGQANPGQANPEQVNPEQANSEQAKQKKATALFFHALEKHAYCVLKIRQNEDNASMQENIEAEAEVWQKIKAQAYQEVQAYLKNGGSPNVPNLVPLSFFFDPSANGAYTQEPKFVFVYPLHIALAQDLIKLLLQYGADLSLPGFAVEIYPCYRDCVPNCLSLNSEKPLLKYNTNFEFNGSKYENLTPMEAAIIREAYDKAWVLLAALDKKLHAEVINESARLMYDKLSEELYEKYLTLSKKRGSSLLKTDILFFKLFDSLLRLSKREVLLTLLSKARQYNYQEENELSKSLKLQENALLSIMQSYRDTQFLMDVLQGYALNHFAQPIGLILKLGYLQEGNIFNALPLEILDLIMAALLHPVMNNVIDIEIAKYKAHVFESIQRIMAQFDDEPAEIYCLSEQEIQDLALNPATQIIDLLEEDDDYEDSDEENVNNLNTKNTKNKYSKTASWILCQHGDRFTSKNIYLIEEIVQWVLDQNFDQYSTSSNKSSNKHRLGFFSCSNEASKIGGISDLIKNDVIKYMKEIMLLNQYESHHNLHSNSHHNDRNHIPDIQSEERDNACLRLGA